MLSALSWDAFAKVRLTRHLRKKTLAVVNAVPDVAQDLLRKTRDLAPKAGSHCHTPQRSGGGVACHWGVALSMGLVLSVGRFDCGPYLVDGQQGVASMGGGGG